MEHPDEYSGIGNVTHYLKDIFENAQSTLSCNTQNMLIGY